MAPKIPIPVEKELRNIEIEITELDSTPPVTFPSAYWNIRNQKPDLSIPQGSINFYYYKMQDLLHRQEWNDDVMAGYLIRYIQTYPAQFETSSPTEWKSNGIVLAKIGEVVNPLTLLYIKGEGKIIVDPEANVDYMKQMRLHHFVSLTMAFQKYIIASLINQTLGTELGRKLDDLLKNSKFPVNGTISSNFTYCNSSNIATTKFIKVLSAIDMFYFRFPNLPAAVLRLGTFDLRYICCDMFSPLSKVINKLSMRTIYELTFFIFSDEICKELRNFMKSGEIDNDPYAYFPYCAGLGIITRSPYSVSQNPTLYLWLHTVLCMLGVAQSYNARMPQSAVEIVPTIHAAAALASIAGELNDTLDGEEESAEVEDRTGPVDPDRPAKFERRRQQAAELLSSFTRFYGLSSDQKVFAKAKADGMRNCPPNSIGLYLHNHFGGL